MRLKAERLSFKLHKQNQIEVQKPARSKHRAIFKRMVHCWCCCGNFLHHAGELDILQTKWQTVSPQKSVKTRFGCRVGMIREQRIQVGQVGQVKGLPRQRSAEIWGWNLAGWATLRKVARLRRPHINRWPVCLKRFNMAQHGATCAYFSCSHDTHGVSLTLDRAQSSSNLASSWAHFNHLRKSPDHWLKMLWRCIHKYA